METPALGGAGDQRDKSVPLGQLLQQKRQLKDARQKLAQVEAERDALKVTLDQVLQWIKNGEERK
ncbi:hypothetical protein [Bradyrhizobium ottawaense]|uniref:hypothetical protein n=1 Tax=Bradyrhizobium ottawaense TaxID=931866 RepID=UPI003515BBCB